MDSISCAFQLRSSPGSKYDENPEHAAAALQSALHHGSWSTLHFSKQDAAKMSRAEIPIGRAMRSLSKPPHCNSGKRCQMNNGQPPQQSHVHSWPMFSDHTNHPCNNLWPMTTAIGLALWSAAVSFIQLISGMHWPGSCQTSIEEQMEFAVACN
eukprot:scaffold104416_cov21-Tisochrysis_lutea.AAC.1